MHGFRRMTLVLGMVLALLGGGVVVAGPAMADDAGELPNCLYYPSTGAGAPYGGGTDTSGVDWYAYSPLWVMPGNSACEDVNITYRNPSGMYPTPLNTWFRVRFYPSGGGSYTNSWKSNNIGVFQNLVIATSVSNGTWLRVEVHRRLADGTQVVDPGYNFDARI